MNKAQRWVAKILGIDLESKAFTTGGGFHIINGMLTPIADNKNSYIDKGYGNDIIYSAINIILDKIRVVPWNLFKVVDESSLKKARSLLGKTDMSIKDFRLAINLLNKALEPIKNYGATENKVSELLKWANPSSTFSNLVTDSCANKIITGDSYLWADMLTAGANNGLPNSFHLLPPQEIVIMSNHGTFPSMDEGYQFMSIGKKYTKEEVLHEKYFNPKWTPSNSHLYGRSPLASALMRLNRNNSAQEASAAMFQNKGPGSIIYVDDNRLPPEVGVKQAAAIKQQLINEYTGPKNMGKMVTSAYKTGVANVGMSPVDLGINESEMLDALMFCNLLGIPPELFGLTAKTYNNVIEAWKAVITGCCLPLIKSIEDNINRKFQTDWGLKGKSLYICPDISVYTELEQNKMDIVNWTAGVFAMSPNEQRIELGLPVIDDPTMDEYWVKGDRKPLSDFQMNEVDKVLSDESDDQ